MAVITSPKDIINSLYLEEMELTKFGVEPMNIEKRDRQLANGLKIRKWEYSIPEKSLLSDDRAYYNGYDMRKTEDLHKCLRWLVIDFYQTYISIDVNETISKSGIRKLTKADKMNIAKEVTAYLIGKTDFCCWIEEGKVWTNEDYDGIKKEIDDNVIDIDVSKMSDSEIADLRSAIDGSTGGRIIRMKYDRPVI